MIKNLLYKHLKIKIYPVLELDKLYVNISITQYSPRAQNHQNLESTKSKQRRREMQEIS
jgi:hypothetical protein